MASDILIDAVSRFATTVALIVPRRRYVLVLGATKLNNRAYDDFFFRSLMRLVAQNAIGVIRSRSFFC